MVSYLLPPDGWMVVVLFSIVTITLSSARGLIRANPAAEAAASGPTPQAESRRSRRRWA